MARAVAVYALESTAKSGFGPVAELFGDAQHGLPRVLQQAHRDLSSARAADVDLTVNLSRLVDLYTAWGKPAVAAEYRALIATHGAGR